MTHKQQSRLFLSLCVIATAGLLPLATCEGATHVYGASPRSNKQTIDVVRSPIIRTDDRESAGLADRMLVTAYCPCRRCCGPRARGITASGAPASGRLVAAPRSWAFGTRVDIPGYGRAQVLDRGGAIRDGRLDVLFQNHDEARRWGVRRLTVRRHGGF